MAVRRSVTSVLATLALAVAGLVGLIGAAATTAAPAGALPPPPTADSVLWTQVQSLPGVVPGASWISDVACPEPGECIAVGNAGDPTVPMYATSTGGVWSPMFPIDVSGLPGYTPDGSRFEAISCFAVLDCTAVGKYATSSTTSRPFSVSVYVTPQPPFAIDFTDIGAFTSAELVDVSCGAVADCGMVGSVLISGVWHAMTVNLLGGGVENARLVTGDGTFHDATGSRGRGVSCVAAGVCTVVGTSSDVYGDYGFAASRTVGSWIPASAVLAPPGAGANPNVIVESGSGAHPVECTADRVCSMVGTYSPHDRRNQVFVASSTGGAFGTGEAVRFPTPYNFESDAISISCPSDGNCVTAGYVFQSGCRNFLDCRITPFAATSRSGTWAPADLLNFSTDIGARHLGGGFDVDCAYTVDDCALVGTFANTAGGFEALGATRTNGEWSQGRRIAGPFQPGSYGDVELWAVDCSTAQRCTATGSGWLDESGESGVVVDTWPMPAGPANVRASVLPGRRVVSVSWEPPPPAVLSCAPSGPGAHVPCEPLNPVPTDYQVRCDTVGGSSTFVGATTSPTWVTVPAASTQRCAVRARYGTPVGASFLGDWFEGPLSGAAPVNVPVVAPDAPTGVRASTPPQPSGRSTLLTYSLPTNVSGAPVTGVEAACTSSNGGTARSGFDSDVPTPVGIVDLTAGKTYSCKVRSRNSAGPSGWAYAPTIVVPAGPPTNVRASTPSSRGTTTVTFTRPDGGPNPSQYRIACTSTNGGTARTLVKNAAPFTVEGLTKGRTYRCTATALFDGTAGPTSAASDPITVP